MKMNSTTIRSEYECLKGKKNLPVYLDNACTTLRPDRVITSIEKYYKEHPSCHNRAVHGFGKQTTSAYTEARSSVQKFINAKSSDEIVFTRNTTESLNLVCHGLGLKSGDVVLTTNMEHNSNLIPWQMLVMEKGIRHVLVEIKTEDSEFNLEAYKRAFTETKIKVVSCFHVSNVTGLTLPIKEMARIAHENGALFILDAAQSITHEKTDVQDLDIDFMAFSFHKAFGPSGFGALYGKLNLLQQLKPLIYGGETVLDASYNSFTFAETPYRLEAGLQNYSGAMGAAEALRYIESIGIENIKEHKVKLNSFVTKELKKHSDLEILGPQAPELRSGIVNFYIKGKDMGEISILLDQSKNIMTRSGFHCCHAWFNHNKLPASLRASFSIYNTMEEAEIFVKTIDQIIQFY